MIKAPDLCDPGAAARMIMAARDAALQRHGRELVNRRYEALSLELAG